MSTTTAEKNTGKIEDVPVLEGWVNMTEAASILGVTRQHIYKRAKNKGFKTLRRLGTQPAYVISTKELEKIIAARTQAKASEDTPVT